MTLTYMGLTPCCGDPDPGGSSVMCLAFFSRQRPYARVLMCAFVFKLARIDGQGEPILLRRQRAGGEVGECTRRIEGLVEIDFDAIRVGQSDVQEAPGPIGLPACGSIRKHTKHTL